MKECEFLSTSAKAEFQCIQPGHTKMCNL